MRTTVRLQNRKNQQYTFRGREWKNRGGLLCRQFVSSCTYNKKQGEMTVKRGASNEAWDHIYSTGQSSRYANEGEIGIYYRLPKFVQMFKKHIPSVNGLNILEIGGGIGEM
jgi:hypothetical protein